MTSSPSKACTKCNVEKPLSEFYRQSKTKAGLHANCKVCSAAYDKAWQVKNRVKIAKRKKEEYQTMVAEGGHILAWLAIKYAGVACMDCETVFPMCVMDFDHGPEETKEFKISGLGGKLATPFMKRKVEKEIAKCDLVCSNCHRVRTQERLNEAK